MVVPTATLKPAIFPTSALEISPTASAYLEAALDIMQENGINRNEVDWPAARTEAFRRARHAQTEAETYDAIRYVMLLAGGRHSHFLAPAEASQSRQSTMSDSPAPRGKLLLEKLGFIAIEWFISNIPEEVTKYANSVQQIIRDLDAFEPCGWIIDLRENTGGNMWPMLAGLGPILGEGKAGAFIDPDGYTAEWSYKEGQALLGDEVLAEVTAPAYQLKTAAPPVAVLTGYHTTSSGEVMVISFRHRPETRSFGLSTGGLSTGNSGFPLSDGAMIILTAVNLADRIGQTYGSNIKPDELVGVKNGATIMDENIPQPAIDWLLVQPACAAQK